jgi:hypothetical protein
MTDEPSKPYTVDRAAPDFLDGDMTRSEMVTVLEGISFAKRGASGTKPIEIDKDIRDYLVALLRHP